MFLLNKTKGNTFSPFHFYFLSNLEKSNFGELQVKIVRPTIFFFPLLSQPSPPHTHTSNFPLLFFFFSSFLKSSQPGTMHT